MPGGCEDGGLLSGHTWQELSLCRHLTLDGDHTRAAIPPGTATVRATATVDGQPVTTRFDAAYIRGPPGTIEPVRAGLGSRRDRFGS